jgi:hypothetical protein
MNLKALITSLVLGSSSLAMAQPTATFSAGASVSFGYPSPSPAVIVRDHRFPTVQPAASDPCNTNTVTPVPAYYRGQRPVAIEPVVYNNPANTRINATGSEYVGTMPFQTMRWFRAPEWVPVTEPTRIDNGREFFNLRAAGSFSKIQLFKNRGASFIKQVTIETLNPYTGRIDTQVVRIDRELTSSFTIDLAGGRRQINRVIVYGSTAQGSAYQILAH